jgi:hypothetical protein
MATHYFAHFQTMNLGHVRFFWHHTAQQLESHSGTEGLIQHHAMKAYG